MRGGLPATIKFLYVRACGNRASYWVADSLQRLVCECCGGPFATISISSSTAKQLTLDYPNTHTHNEMFIEREERIKYIYWLSHCPHSLNEPQRERGDLCNLYPPATHFTTLREPMWYTLTHPSITVFAFKHSFANCSLHVYTNTKTLWCVVCVNYIVLHLSTIVVGSFREMLLLWLIALWRELYSWCLFSYIYKDRISLCKLFPMSM